MEDRDATERRIRARLDGSPVFIKAVRDLRRMANELELDPVAPKPGQLSDRDLLQQRAVSAIQQQDFVPSSVQDIRGHLEEARGVRHPEEGWGAAEAAPPSLRAAVRRMGEWQ
eukprot:scaffold13931_cov116-Isochrysis_galbana.AAC.1